MATISLLWKVNFCWKPCRESMKELICYVNQGLICKSFNINSLDTFPHCLHLPSCRLRCTQWWRTIIGWTWSHMTKSVSWLVPPMGQLFYQWQCSFPQLSEYENGKLTSRKFLELDSLKEGLHLKLIWNAEKGEQKGKYRWRCIPSSWPYLIHQ